MTDQQAAVAGRPQTWTERYATEKERELADALAEVERLRGELKRERSRADFWENARRIGEAHKRAESAEAEVERLRGEQKMYRERALFAEAEVERLRGELAEAQGLLESEERRIEAKFAAGRELAEAVREQLTRFDTRLLPGLRKALADWDRKQEPQDATAEWADYWDRDRKQVDE